MNYLTNRTFELEGLLNRLNSPRLIRLWMAGNFRWLLHVLCGALFTLSMGILSLVSPSPLAATLFVIGLVSAVFLFKFTGIKQGLLLQPLTALPDGKKEIALTFDDGPNEEQTEKILAILQQLGVSASFFLSGVQVDKHPQIALNIAAQGHDIGSHGHTHRNLRFAGPNQLKQEFHRFELSLAAAGLKKTRLYRPPHGAKSPLLESYLKKRGDKLILWNLTAKDWKTEPADTILQRLLQHTRPGAIVLLHDCPNAVAILPDYIATLKKAGYRFRKISEFV